MRLLDLFCGQGGAAVGYHQAGYDTIVGVDNRPMPRYPFYFVQGDALEVLAEIRLSVRLGIDANFDLIHASPPCQRWSKMSTCRPGLQDSYTDYISDLREALQATGLPYVIENVPRAPLRRDLELCGCHFGLRSPQGLQVRRARWFETEPRLPWPEIPHNHNEPALPVYGHSPGKEWIQRYGGRYAVPLLAERNNAMGTPWMDRNGLAEAIPPAFTSYIGTHLLARTGARSG